MKKLVGLFVTVGALLLATMPAQAQTFPGSPLLIQNGGSAPRSLFDFIGSDTIEMTGDITGNARWFLSSDGGVSYTRLVGIRTIYLVNPNGSQPSGVTIPSNPNNGYVETVQGGTRTNWVQFDSNGAAAGGYKGWDNNGPGMGFADGSNWLVLAQPSLAGKNNATNTDKFGHFDFDVNLFVMDQIQYSIGFDYILEGGQTARGYITNAGSRIPEPGTLALLSLTLPGVAALVRRRRAA